MNYKISRNLEYALMALAYMSKRKNYCVSAREMTETFNCPFHPFSRVLQKMADGGFIQSQKGIGGGYIFSCSLDKMSLYELMSVVLPPVELADCLSGYCHLLDHCNIRSPIHYLNKKFLQFYKTLSLKEILTCNPALSLSPNRRVFKSHNSSQNRQVFKSHNSSLKRQAFKNHKSKKNRQALKSHNSSPSRRVFKSHNSSPNRQVFKSHNSGLNRQALKSHNSSPNRRVFKSHNSSPNRRVFKSHNSGLKEKNVNP